MNSSAGDNNVPQFTSAPPPQSMLDGYKKRVEKYEVLRESTVHRAKLSFQQLLSRRGYDGKLKINFENQSLVITVRWTLHNRGGGV